MEAQACIFCHKPSTLTALEEKGYQGKQCVTCNLIFISPRPSQAEIANLYGHDEAHLRASSHIDNSLSKTLQAKHTLKLIKKYRTTGSLLEIGAGAGYFLHEAQKQRFTVEGIELNPTQARFITTKLGIPCSTDNLATFAEQKRQFDIIYHCDVISHFFDPIEEFKSMHSMLSNDGIMIFETGNIADIAPRWYKAFTAFQYPDHLFFFGEQSIRQLLALTDFECLAIHHYNIAPQLMVIKGVNRLKKQTKKPIKTDSGVSTPNDQKVLPAYSLLKKGYHYSQHFMRYKLGALITPQQVPQTLIVIAQKKR